MGVYLNFKSNFTLLAKLLLHALKVTLLKCDKKWYGFM